MAPLLGFFEGEGDGELLADRVRQVRLLPVRDLLGVGGVAQPALRTAQGRRRGCPGADGIGAAPLWRRPSTSLTSGEGAYERLLPHLELVGPSALRRSARSSGRPSLGD